MVNKSAKENFFKISLNGSYGHDAMNTENYSKSFIQNEARANTSKLSDQFKNIRQLVDKEKDQTYDSIYQVDMDSDKFKCQTPLQQAYFTLDNAKYWFLVFIYEFMYKCMDMNKIHFIYGDTDSMYYAISGCEKENYNQGFKHVVLDKEYYDEHVFKFLPFDTFCFQESSRPTLNTMIDSLLDTCTLTTLISLVKSIGTDEDMKILNDRIMNLKRTEQIRVLKSCLKSNLKDNEKFIQISHTKKLLGLAIEKQGENMCALGPKCYTQWNNDNSKPKLKVKGVKLGQNKHITSESYVEILYNGGIESGYNTTLQMKNGNMARLTMNKIAITSKNNKGIVLENGVVLPFVFGAKYECK
jgi:hypothetical protein